MVYHWLIPTLNPPVVVKTAAENGGDLPGDSIIEVNGARHDVTAMLQKCKAEGGRSPAHEILCIINRYCLYKDVV